MKELEQKVNAVIDRDGVIIAVDIVNGGFGYTTPPLARAIDPCENGNGAVFDTEIRRGRVTRVIVRDGGLGYLPGQGGYPAMLRLTDVIVTNPGINYDCGKDVMEICGEGNGTILSYQCNPFGKISKVDVVSGGLFTELPTICLHSLTGINAEFVPVLEVIRDPILPVEKEKVVQVYDLVGLNVNGYIDGKLYYGKIYFDQGVKFAGTPNTGGKVVRVYDTRVESIQSQG